MIVVDTNVIAYLYLPGVGSELAERALEIHGAWAAPSLWRSELRNVLALYLRKDLLSLESALQIQAQAEALMAGNEHEVRSEQVLPLALVSRCSAYDCEFVVLADQLQTTLVTADTRLHRKFPNRVRLLNTL